jgi:hypothetical protein
MSLNQGPTIDDLLADSLIRTVMRADHVEPQALRALLGGAAGRLAARRRRAATVFVSSTIARRRTFLETSAPAAAGRTARVSGEDCGSARCC